MRRRKLSQDKLESRRTIIRRFREANNNKPATTLEIADWAIRKGLWSPHPVEVRSQLSEELSQAMREEYLHDPQGRRVRAKHAAHDEQGVLWVDIRDSRPDTRQYLEIAFQNRRQQIVGDCRQLKTDIDSYNQNWNTGEPIQYCFDFTDDLAELELANSA
jgi:hypothetical protein